MPNTCLVQASRTLLEGQARAALQFGKKDAPLAVAFVLFVKDGERWLKPKEGCVSINTG